MTDLHQVLWDLGLDPATSAAFDELADLDKLIVECCIRAPGDLAVELIVGCAIEHRAIILRAIAQLAPTHHARIARWLDALPSTLDLGFKLGATGSFQVYVHGEYSAATLDAAFQAIDIPSSPVLLRNMLSLFDVEHAVLAGLELSADRAGGAVYVQHLRSRQVDSALAKAVAFYAAGLVPASTATWPAVAAAILAAPADELVHVAFSPSATTPWIKVDVTDRPRAFLRPLLDAANLSNHLPPALAHLERHAISAWSHIGVRLGPDGISTVFYWHP